MGEHERAFGVLVTERRKAARLTREHLARLCGISSSSIKKAECGRGVSLSTCSALLATPELRLTVADLPVFAREPLRHYKEDTRLLRLGLSLAELAGQERVLAGVKRFASSRTLPELGEWAEAKLLTLHKLRSALYSSDELAGSRPCASAAPCCFGFSDQAVC